MQIVINIDDKAYGLLKYFEEALGLDDKKDNNDDVKTALMRAVINGTPLPEHHSDLIDSDTAFNLLNQRRDAHDKMMANYEPYRNTQIPKWVWDAIVEQTTIIEADKGVRNK